jgi:NADH-quinone oxidoreductase subunit M
VATPELAQPWLAVALAAPLAGALVVRRHAAGEVVRPRAVAAAAVAFVAALGLLVEWSLGGSAAPVSDPLDPGARLLGVPLFEIDELSAWILPFAALVFAAALLVAPRRALGAGLATRLLVAEAVVLALFACRHRAGIAVLWALSVLPLVRELRAECPRALARVFERYMALSVLLLAGGFLALALAPPDAPGLRAAGTAAVLAAAAVRKGIVPFHSWMPEFFAGAPLGAAHFYCMPQVAAYLLVRVAAPEAPEWLLLGFGAVALATAIYGAGAALVQDDPRRAFGWLFMSQSALVMAGLDCSSEVGLAGGLALWISGGIALGGFGLTLWVLEARRGSLSLHGFHGGYERMSLVAVCFLVFGLASVGFPGTLGFVGQELLVDGAVTSYPHVGIGVAIAAALNGICVVRMYFALFCGARDRSTEPLQIRPREAVGFATLAALLVVGGLAPGPFIDSRARAAEELMRGREPRSAGGGLLRADLRHDVALAVPLRGEVDLVADGEASEQRRVVDREGHGHRVHEPGDLAVLDRDLAARGAHSPDHAMPGAGLARGLGAAADPGDRGRKDGGGGEGTASQTHRHLLPPGG